MPNKNLTDSEIVKEIQGIKESMKRHIDLTNEMGQDLLRIDEEYTGGSKVWLTTDYFQKVVKHFSHSNYLVKCLELVFDYINRLQAENERLKSRKEIAVPSLRFIDGNPLNGFNLESHRFVARTVEDVKAEAYKECMARVEDRLSHRLDPELFPYIRDCLRDELEKMVGGSNEKT